MKNSELGLLGKNNSYKLKHPPKCFFDWKPKCFCTPQSGFFDWKPKCFCTLQSGFFDWKPYDPLACISIKQEATDHCYLLLTSETSTHQRTIHWMDAHYYSVMDEPQLS
jgi:hypothetical protein